jgi:hypothetical protein
MHDSETVNDTPTEAEGRRELAQHGVLPCIAGGVERDGGRGEGEGGRGEGGRGGDDLYSVGRAIPPALPRSWSAASF